MGPVNSEVKCGDRLVAVGSKGLEGIVENSATVGEYFKTKLATLNSEIIHEVRGKGLMIAVELTRQAGGARWFCEALTHSGVRLKCTYRSMMINSCFMHLNLTP